MNYLSSRRAVRLMLIVVLFVGAGVMLWLAHRELSDLAALQARGATTSATVTDRYSKEGRNSKTYFVAYTFTAESISVTRRDDVAYSIYRNADTGSPLLVTYLPSHPQTVRVGVVNSALIENAHGAWVFAISLALVIWGIAFVAIPLRVQEALDG